MTNPLLNKHILLGVTGSIAAYKAADLASKLAQAGAQVETVLTEAALKFVAPLTFQSVTGCRAYTEADLWGSEGHVQHIGLGKGADLLMIAPASANTLAKLAHGLADNLLTLAALAAQCPILVAPAMDGGMFLHPATQANLEILRQRGVIVIGPAEGHLASGLSGIGRMIEPLDLLGQARFLLSRRGPLKDCKIVITAGGTQEPIDPVRSIANRSSGKQGFALAQAGLDLGGEVTLIAGNVNLASKVMPSESESLAAAVGAQRVDVSTANEMLQAVLEAISGAEALVMAAAVADFRPVQAAAQKLKKEQGIPKIKLEATPDILQQVAQTRLEGGWPRLVIGFAAESQDLLENARKKIHAKSLDMIVANNINTSEAGFGVDTNQVTLLYPDGKVEAMPLMSKMEVAEAVMERVVMMIGNKR
jgi:phosphopantothenoylcysteine decarboxylase/phosphopantothenate--cysteine ligase